MSFFSKVAEAQVTGRARKLNDMPLDEDREYVVRLGDIIHKPSNRGGGDLYIVEFTVLKGTDARPPGTRASWVERPQRLSGPENIKAFVNACLGRDDPDAPQTEAEGEASLDGAYRGRVLTVVVTHIKTQESQRDFFVHTWSPFRGDAAALIAALPEETAAAPATAAPPPPPKTEVLTKEAWLAGEGPGVKGEHGEWNPDNPSWGWR